MKPDPNRPFGRFAGLPVSVRDGILSCGPHTSAYVHCCSPFLGCCRYVGFDLYTIHAVASKQILWGIVMVAILAHFRLATRVLENKSSFVISPRYKPRIPRIPVTSFALFTFVQTWDVQMEITYLSWSSSNHWSCDLRITLATRRVCYHFLMFVESSLPEFHLDTCLQGNATNKGVSLYAVVRLLSRIYLFYSTFMLPSSVRFVHLRWKRIQQWFWRAFGDINRDMCDRTVWGIICKCAGPEHGDVSDSVTEKMHCDIKCI
jgi:hypothetical protein